MEDKKRVNFIVTDLDDTIWNWLRMWYNSFEPYLKRISNEFDVDSSILKNEFKIIHQKYRSSEASFVYNEISCLTPDQKKGFEIPSPTGKSILHEYYSLKKNNLFLYDGVLKTLKKIKEEGVIIVGFTESNAFFTKYRIKHLRLDGIIDYIYAPIDTGVPKGVYTHYSEDFWEPEITEIRYLSRGATKPAPEILEIILRDFKASKENTIYIGDKLDKDIQMANEAGVDSVYAMYGHEIGSKQYQLLREVTHWTESDVEREKEYKKLHTEKEISKYTLQKSFSELFGYFDFFRFNTKSSSEKISHVIAIWKKTIDVQQHFNDIELRIRNIALTAFTFIIGGIGYLEKEKLGFLIEDCYVPYSSILSLLGLIIMFSFFYMDRYWYHKLLMGAVKQGSQIESNWSRYIPEIILTQAIGKESPQKIFKLKIHTKHKFWIFYGLLFSTLIILGVAMMMIKNIA